MMRLSYLRTYFDADDAHCIIEFLDEIKDRLWETYGTEIIERQQQHFEQKTEDDQTEHTMTDIDDEIPF